MSNTPGRSSYFCFSMDLPDHEAAQKVAQQFAGQLGWNAGERNCRRLGRGQEPGLDGQGNGMPK